MKKLLLVGGALLFSLTTLLANLSFRSVAMADPGSMDDSVLTMADPGSMDG